MLNSKEQIIDVILVIQQNYKRHDTRHRDMVPNISPPRYHNHAPIVRNHTSGRKTFLHAIVKNPWPSSRLPKSLRWHERIQFTAFSLAKTRTVSWCMVTRLLKEHRQHSVAAPPRGNTHNRPPNGTSSALLLFTISANHQNHFLIKTQIEFSKPKPRVVDALRVHIARCRSEDTQCEDSLRATLTHTDTTYIKKGCEWILGTLK